MSNKGKPSMVALLGLLAVAGYQHKDKIGQMIRNSSGSSDPDGDRPHVAGSAGFLDEIGSIFGGAGGGASLSEAVMGLVENFRGAGQGPSADSWVEPGTNQGVNPELSMKTGLPRAEILSRLSRTVPEAVDRMTPDGRIPSATEAQAFI